MRISTRRFFLALRAMSKSQRRIIIGIIILCASYFGRYLVDYYLLDRNFTRIAAARNRGEVLDRIEYLREQKATAADFPQAYYNALGTLGQSQLQDLYKYKASTLYFLVNYDRQTSAVLGTYDVYE